MMNHLSLLLMVMIIISCKSNPGENQLDHQEIILGEWEFIEIFGIQCYVCPRVFFLKNGEGVFFFSENDKINFKYEINSEHIKVAYSDSSGQDVQRQIIPEGILFTLNIDRSGNAASIMYKSDEPVFILKRSATER